MIFYKPITDIETLKTGLNNVYTKEAANTAFNIKLLFYFVFIVILRMVCKKT